MQGLRIRCKYCGGWIRGGLQSIGVDADNRKAILLALAWIGDEKVVGRFREWQATPGLGRHHLPNTVICYPIIDGGGIRVG